MTPKARAAYELYRDLGPKRTLQRVANLQGRPRRRGVSVLKGWSAKYGWQKLTADHDHAKLRKALGGRENMRERTTQLLVEAQDEMVELLLAVARDTRTLPVMDRQGIQVVDANGEPVYKPLVRTSTRVETIKWILGVVGHVPVKRMEVIDHSAEKLAEAATAVGKLSDTKLALLIADDDPDQPGD